MIQILIVDDEKPICDLIQMSLTRADYHCTCVYDGLAAADILERNVFDLILLDVMLPNADGFELMEYISPLGIPVIFLTARGSVDDRVRGLRMGAEDYIVKPFEVVELLARVDVVLRRYNKTDAVIEIGGLLEHLKRLYAQKGIALQYRTEEGACFLEPDLFKTLLVNLMDNARKALDSGGNIYVWQEMLPDGCRVRVLDNGRGIPPEALTHLTEAFYRVDKSRSRAQGGAGLGLSLCNEIVQLHGGTMQFESRVGNGTVVTVELKGGRV